MLGFVNKLFISVQLIFFLDNVLLLPELSQKFKFFKIAVWRSDSMKRNFGRFIFMKSYICNGHTVHAVSRCNLDRNMVFAKPIYIVQSKVTKWYDKRGQGYLLCNWVEYHGANLSGILCFARKCLFVCTLGSQALQFHYGCRYQ